MKEKSYGRDRDCYSSREDPAFSASGTENPTRSKGSPSRAADEQNYKRTYVPVSKERDNSSEDSHSKKHKKSKKKKKSKDKDKDGDSG